MKSGRSGSQIGQAQLGLSCKAIKCSDAGTGDLGVLTAHAKITNGPIGDAHSTRPRQHREKTQVQVSMDN